MDARPQGVPYEVTIEDQYSFFTFRKPSRIPPQRSHEFREPFLAEAGIYPSDLNYDKDDAPVDEQTEETEWSFTPWSHEQLMTIKFYVHSLRDTVFDLYEDAGYDFGYSIQPFDWNRVTAVVSVPRPGVVEPCMQSFFFCYCYC